MRRDRRFQAYNLAEMKARRREDWSAVAVVVVTGLVLLIISGLGLPPR